MAAQEDEEEETRLQCPLCDEFFEVMYSFLSICQLVQLHAFFQAGQVRELEFHVETHLATSSSCPVCQESFSLASQAEFVRHVQVRAVLWISISPL